MKIKHILLGLVLLCFGVVIVNTFHKNIWEINAKHLREEILSLSKIDEDILLQETTPFEWDTLYSFIPYTPKETIYETVGYKWDQISEALSEGMMQIVFLNNGEVVCYIFGYPSNLGYGILMEQLDSDHPYVKIHAEDQALFKVTQSESIVYLINK